MAVMCAACIRSKDIRTRPPVRIIDRNCEFCNGRDHPALRNYDIPDELVHGSKRDPNRQAETEEVGR